ncbi:MAG: biotin-independent malonate decarboxylase subunit beta [Verrucomicrobia bacterium]|nr:biotin-independent malonate decarboxylase subunit beta [Verrucomicrobiota bacterium]
MKNALVPSRTGSWYEATARERISGLLDAGTFHEFLGPTARAVSPHLALFDLPEAFDDGIIVGRGKLQGRAVLVAAQEGRFMGGTFGEVHGAKLVGLLRYARDHHAEATSPRAVLLLLDTGGVRLQEANVGELAVSEIIRALVEARAAGVAVIALVGGRAGAFGGGGILAACCSRVVISEQGRTSVSGPEVIETNMGAEEFDSLDRPLVWRTTGGKTRRLLGGAGAYAADRIESFRAAALALLDGGIPAFDLATLAREQARLAERLEKFGACQDAPEIWQRMRLADAARIADLADEDFNQIAQAQPEANHDAR